MMTLSEAIRNGAKMSGPQLFGSLFDPAGGPEGGTCAMGAALLGLYGAGTLWAFKSELYHGAIKSHPILMREVPAPCGCSTFSSLMDLSIPRPNVIWRGLLISAIVHLNNDHRWSREAIAEWVGAVEQQVAAEEARLKADLDEIFPVQAPSEAAAAVKQEASA